MNNKMTFPTEIDATQLSTIRFNIPGVAPALQPTRPEDTSEHIGPMDPGTYKIYVVGWSYRAIRLKSILGI